MFLGKIQEKLNNLSVSKKIHVLTLPALGVICAFSIILILQNLKLISDSDTAIKGVEYASILDNVAHNFAVERGLTAGYLGSKGTKGRDKLSAQREKASAAEKTFNELYKADYPSLPKNLQNAFDNLKSALAKVPGVRAKVDQLASNSNAFATYSTINKIAINAIQLSSFDVNDVAIVKDLNAMVNVLWLKERSGQERGALNGVFASGKFSTNKVLSVSNYLQEQNARVETLQQFVPQALMAHLDKINKSEASAQVSQFRSVFNNAVLNATTVDADAGEWFKVSTARIKDIKSLADAIKSSIKNQAEQIQADAIASLSFAVIAALVIISAVFGIGKIINSQLSRNISTFTRSFNDVRTTKDFSIRCDIQSKDELGKSADAFNSLMEQLQTVIDSVNQSLIAMTRGNFENKVTMSLEGDLLILKNGVNDSIEKVHFTMEELGNVMKALEAGNFSARMSEQIEGQFRQQVDTAMTTMNDAMTSVSEVVHAISQGDFSKRVEMPLKGSLDSLKTSINTSADAIEEAIQSISNAVSAQSDGDFSARVHGEFNGQLKLLTRSVNDSISTLDDAVQEINSLFKDLSLGDFEQRLNLTLKGDLDEMKQGINTTLTKLDAAIKEILNVASDQAKGKLDSTITGQYQGQLDALKQSINTAGSTINTVVDDIGNAMLLMNEGDFSSQIETPMQGSFDELKENFNLSMASLNQVISDIKQVSQAQSDGNLTQRVSSHYKGDLKEISESVNSSLEAMSSIVTNIKQSGDSTLTLARKQTEAANSISRRTESQASSLEEIAATMEELSTSVQETSNEVGSMEHHMDKVKHASHSCQQAIGITVDKMDRIKSSSASMETFTNLIDEISFQTNLLALNAAVESARAGSHGKGFGVVAAEVRNLAQRSAQAAKEIKSLINENVSIVEEGYEAITSSSEQISSISDVIEESIGLINNIYTASSEQARGVQEVNTAIAQLDSDTQHNAAMLDSTTNAAKSVEEQAFAVNKSLQFFKAANY